MDTVQTFLSNAEIAFSNKQFAESLTWYQKALAETPDDLYVLSRAGAICVSLGKYEEALGYFEHAKDLDPQNGDNLFNYANACFFQKDYAAAFANYVEAEKAGCSDDVTPRLYYQMALLCSLRQDVRSALVYLDKCEQADASGLFALNPDLISEKLKLHLALEEYAEAEKDAAQLVAIQPTEFRNYMVYFSILMAHQSYAEAGKILNDAERYAELTDDYRFALSMQKASVLVAEGEAGKAGCLDKAIELLRACEQEPGLSANRKTQVVFALSEAYLKVESYDQAISGLYVLLHPAKPVAEAPSGKQDEIRPLSEDELEQMIQEEMARMQERIDRGEIDDNFGQSAEIEYDEEGNERHVYDPSVFAPVEESQPDLEEAPDEPAENETGLSFEDREKAYFLLLTAFLGKEDFAGASGISRVLKHSGNKYYGYFALYADALAARKRNGNTEEVERKYAEAIAFFRNKSFANPSDSMAVLFRARLYIEQGKREKAKELANLLSENDRKTILEYEKSYPNA